MSFLWPKDKRELNESFKAGSTHLAQKSHPSPRKRHNFREIEMNKMAPATQAAPSSAAPADLTVFDDLALVGALIFGDALAGTPDDSAELE
jgi:hypothetical protein